MKQLIVIYRSSDSLWADACTWASDNGVERKVISESCYRGMNYRATMFYAQSESIASDYAVRGVERLTDEQLSGGEDS